MMKWDFERMYSVFLKNNQKLLLDGLWGVERELQRVTYEGDLALTPHPPAFGDKLVNKEITTDFSESQMELITPPFPSVEEVDRYLSILHKKAEQEVGDEFLWPLSMPPRLPEEELIPIAVFPDTTEGQAAYRYRQGLANRYGKKMQMISGIHFNFSFGKDLLKLLHKEFGENHTKTEFADEIYFSVARNFLRYRWLLIYLYGASPSYDATYASVMTKEVEIIRKCCPECCSNYDRFATSLRVSRYGYANPVQVRNYVYYNTREEYIQKIRALMTRKSKKYAKIDKQLNDKILQKDSEFYSSIRLKQITKPGESQLDALERRGVQYAEVRILDVNPFVRNGISLEQMYFLQVFMLFCLFEEKQPLDLAEMKLINKNHHMVALSGRKAKLMLYHPNGGRISMIRWGESIFERLILIAGLLDKATDSSVYSRCIQSEYEKLKDSTLLPSSRIIEESNHNRESFLESGMRIAKANKFVNKMEVSGW